MIGLNSQILDMDEKLIMKDALFLYVSDLQKRYYGDGILDKETYFAKMQEVEGIAEKLHLTDLYR